MKEKTEHEININLKGKYGFTKQAEFQTIAKEDIIFNYGDDDESNET